MKKTTTTVYKDNKKIKKKINNLLKEKVNKI